MPSTNILGKEPKASTPDGKGHCTVPMVPHCTLHLVPDCSIELCKPSVFERGSWSRKPCLCQGLVSDSRWGGLNCSWLISTQAVPLFSQLLLRLVAFKSCNCSKADR